MNEDQPKLIFERKSHPTNHVKDEEVVLEPIFSRKDLPLPELNEVDVIRHYTLLSRRNYGVDNGIYPLGSCTMKYNPKINEDIASLEGFASIHPLTPEKLSQGALRLVYELERYLCEITGMDAFTLQPAAGAHGELTAMMIAKAYFKGKRRKVIVPDSAHGTNPASAAICGFSVINIPSGKDGCVDMGELENALSDDVAVLMLTNPNTLGLFERRIEDIAKLVHGFGALLYCDGANMNAMLGISRPGDQGFDILHLNLHKTFATPHGGGGPGAGPVGVKSFLADYLPIPRIKEKKGKYVLDYRKRKSIGRVRAFYGNFGVLVKAYAYIRAVGKEIRRIGEQAVINANYLRSILKDHYPCPYDRFCAHEFVLSGEKFLEKGVHTMDIAKRMLDYGIHAPTIYFPLIVKEALMVEPTETESKENLDRLADVMIRIAKEAVENPELLKNAPHRTPVRRLDGVLAARKPNLRWSDEA